MSQAEINLFPKQTEAWEAWESSDITELGYGGAAGGGKTRLGWYLCIAICEQYPGARGAVGRKELKTLRMTTLVELWTIFKELGYKKDTDYTFNASDNVLKFHNGSEIILLDTAYSPQDAEYTRFGSLPLTFAWLDESNETPEKAKAILKTRVGRANLLMIGGKEVKVKAFWLETFNPNKGHVHRDYYKPWKTNTLPSYRKFIRALPGDNPRLPREYIENLNRSDKATRERLLKGNFEFDDDPQKLMIYDAITDLPTNTLLPTPHTNTKYIIADIARFGGDKIVIGTFKGLELYSLGVYTYQGLDETAKKIKDESVAEEVAYKYILADEDGVGGGVIDMMRGIKGFHGGSSALLTWDYIKGKLVPANFQNFRCQCQFKLAEMVNNHLISVKIKKFQTNIEGYTKEQAMTDLFEELDAIKETDNSDGGKKAVIPKIEIKEQLGRSPDFSDILMMRMFFELKDDGDPGLIPAGRNRSKVVVNKAR